MPRFIPLLLVALVLTGCATIPEDRYGVRRLRIEGMEDMDEYALRACLATRERAPFSLDFGTSTELECGAPPFDGSRLSLRLWFWPWTDWPTYDMAVLERDLERIQRWYRARGYYQARILSVETQPADATVSDRVDAPGDEAPCERDDEDEGCRVRIVIQVEEGEPVLVRSVDLSGGDELGEEEREVLEDAIALEEGERFDEAIHDQGKTAMRDELQDRGFACADVSGSVDVDPEERLADVHYRVTPGPKAVVGQVRVTGAEDLPTDPILGAADVSTGDAYTRRKIADARRAVFALGAFGSVDIVGTPARDASGQCTGVVDLEIKVTPGRRIRYGVGAGIQSGTLEYYNQGNTVNQWDVHLLTFVEHRNLFGGLRRLRLEDRPKIIFPGFFPTVQDENGDVDINFGNTLSLQFTQPAFIEPRTTMIARAVWDYGPDPYDGFLRHDIDGAVGWNRTFFEGRLTLSGGLHGNRLYADIPDNLTDDVSPYRLMFWEQHAQLNIATDGQPGQRGVILRLDLEEAGYGMPSTWDYVRMSPEVRGYIPLPAGIVLAARFNMGMMFITNVNAGEDPARPGFYESLDPVSATLGPQRYRIRGGGANSHRGFLPGFLGDVGERVPGTGDTYRDNAGGLTRWVASLELRVPMGESARLAVFTDMGDVNRELAFRMNYLRMAVGVGFRYLTIVGPFRFDIAALVPHAQIVGQPDPAPTNQVNFGFAKFAGAVHITIGEAF